MTHTLPRTLEHCPLVIFIAYTVPADAEPRGYSDWLVRVDNPFFNAIPGTHHYANWRVGRVLRGGAPVWDYFDFQGLCSGADLERVWFNPDLDAFRAEWIRLWGYGEGTPAPVLRHAYLMRRLSPAPAAGAAPAGTAMELRAGTGPVPEGLAADGLFRVEGVLRKHFATPDKRPDDWLTPAGAGNPLGLDWLALRYGAAEAGGPGSLVLDAGLIARPAP